MENCPNNYPTAADYANSAAQEAEANVKKLTARVFALETQLNEALRLIHHLEKGDGRYGLSPE